MKCELIPTILFKRPYTYEPAVTGGAPCGLPERFPQAGEIMGRWQLPKPSALLARVVDAVERHLERRLRRLHHDARARALDVAVDELEEELGCAANRRLDLGVGGRRDERWAGG